MKSGQYNARTLEDMQNVDHIVSATILEMEPIEDGYRI